MLKTGCEKMLLPWDSLPEWLRTEETAPYYQRLFRRRGSLMVKRGFDLVGAVLLLAVLSPVLLACGLAVKFQSGGKILFCQERVTQYGRRFQIYKFRTMVPAEGQTLQLTVGEDKRVTQVGRFLRKTRLDELPQLWNILKGEMSFVGTRPEVPRYVASYTPEMLATLLLPAGLTSRASVAYRREAFLLNKSENPESTYIKEVLPDKMRYNLGYLKHFSLWEDARILLRTLAAFFR